MHERPRPLTVLVTVKQLGKKRDKIQKQPFTLPYSPATLRQLIEGAVSTCYGEHKRKAERREDDLPAPLSQAEIEERSEIGKIAFGIVYDGRMPTLAAAQQTAVQAFEDGLFRVFLNGEEQTDLDKPLTVNENDELVFIRLNMLAGRLW